MEPSGFRTSCAITVDSRPSEGTRFTIELPCKAPVAATVADTAGFGTAPTPPVGIDLVALVGESL